MDKIISITGRDRILHGKHVDGYYFIQPSFSGVNSLGRSFLFYDEYMRAVRMIKTIVYPFVNDEKYSSLSDRECRAILDRMEVEFKDFLSA